MALINIYLEVNIMKLSQIEAEIWKFLVLTYRHFRQKTSFIQN